MKNKKIIYTVFMLSLYAVLSGCLATPPEPAQTSPEVYTDAPEPEVSPSDDRFVGCDIPFVLDVNQNYSSDSFIKGIPELDTEGIKTLPVYKDLYPVGHGGVEYEVDDTVTHTVYSNLVSFLNMTGIEVDSEKLVLVPYPGAEDKNKQIYIYDPDGYTVRASVNGVSVEYDMSRLTEANDRDEDVFSLLRDDVYLSAACKHIGINKPKLSRISSYNLLGEDNNRAYTVYDPGDTYFKTIYKRNFNKLWLSCYPTDEGLGSLLITDIDTSKKVGEFKLIPYKDAFAGLNGVLDYEVSPENIIASEILYSTRVVHGYYVPCYIFYADMGETHAKGIEGMHTYVTFYYPAVEFTDILNGVTEYLRSENDFNESFYPELITEDISGDGKDEITLIVTEAEGSGVLLQKAYIFDPVDFAEYKVIDPLEIIGDKVTSSVNIVDGKVKIGISVSGETYETVFDEDYAIHWAEGGAVFKNVINYEVEGQRLKAIVPVQVSDVLFIGDLVITYTLEGSVYNCDMVEYKPYEF